MAMVKQRPTWRLSRPRRSPLSTFRSPANLPYQAVASQGFLAPRKNLWISSGRCASTTDSRGHPAGRRCSIFVLRMLMQAACKPGSVPAGDAGGGRPFLWDARHHTPRATYPDDRPGSGPAPAGAVVPMRSCSRWGLPCRRRCRWRGALLPHPFTLTRRRPRSPRRADCSLWHFPWGRPRRALPGTVLPWSPDFPPPPSPAGAAVRPPASAR